MLRKFILLVLIFMTIYFIGYSQDNRLYKKKYQTALNFIYKSDFTNALPILLELDTVSPSKIDKFVDQKNIPQQNQHNDITFFIKYNIGLCYYNQNYNRNKGIEYFEHILKSKYNKIPDDIYIYIGKLYHINYQFDRAILCFDKYIQLIDLKKDQFKKNDSKYVNAKRMSEICKNAVSFYSDSLKTAIHNVGSPINTPNSEYNPLISADDANLFYNSIIYSETNNIIDSSKRIMVSHKENYKWNDPKRFFFNLPPTTQISLAGLSPDGDEMFIQVGEKDNTDIYLCRKVEDRCEELKKLNIEINSKFYEGKVSITADGTEIYFSSNRPGGYGGKDLYKATKDDKGNWINVINLGPNINTEYDEEAPYIHPDKKTLFFSSTGHNTMGGYDIFKSKVDDKGVWVKPENMGYPINSPLNDLDFSLSASGQTGYFSKSQNDKFNNRDIYSFIINQNIPLTLVKGTILAGNPLKPIPAIIKVVDKETNSRIKYIYNPNPKTGKYLMIFPPGKDYNIIIEAKGYLPQMINVHIPNQSYFYELFQEIHLNSLNLLDKTLGEEISVTNTFVDVYRSAAGDSVLTKSGKKDYGKLLNLVENLINTTDSIGLEKIDETYESVFKDEIVSSENYAKEDIDKLLNYIEKAIQTTDSVTLFLLEKNTLYNKDYKQKYFYSEENKNNLVPVIIGKDTIYTAPPLYTKEYDVSSRIIDSPIKEIIPDKSKMEIKDIKIEEKKVILTYSVYFPTGKANIEEKYFNDLKEIVKLLKSNFYLYIEIYGFSDSRGSESENLELSDKRAKIVLEFFNNCGIDTETAIINSLGKSMSVNEKSETDRQKNRRVDIKIFEFIKNK